MHLKLLESEMMVKSYSQKYQMSTLYEILPHSQGHILAPHEIIVS